MNNEKICPVYSASDNTARKCIKEECGWWCDQCNACAVVSASDSDIYVLYYTPASLSLKEISKQELLNIISKTLCKDKADHDDRGE